MSPLKSLKKLKNNLIILIIIIIGMLGDRKLQSNMPRMYGGCPMRDVILMDSPAGSTLAVLKKSLTARFF